MCGIRPNLKFVKWGIYMHYEYNGKVTCKRTFQLMEKTYKDDRSTHIIRDTTNMCIPIVLYFESTFSRALFDIL